MTEVESGQRDRRVRDVAARVPRSRLSAMRVAELRTLAESLGVGNTSTMRKGTLVDAINEQYDTDTEQEAPEGVTATDDRQVAAEPTEVEPQADPPREPEQDDAVAPAAEPIAEPVADAAPEQAEPTGSTSVDPVEPSTEQVAEPAAAAEDAPTADEAPSEDAAPAADAASVPSVDEAIGGAEADDAVVAASGTAAPKSASGHVNAGLTGIAEDLQALQRGEAEAAAPQGDEQGEGEGERQGNRRGRGRGRGRNARGDQNGQAQNGQAQNGQAADGQAQNGQQAQPEAEQADAQPAKQEQQPKQDAQQKADQGPDRPQNQQGQQDGDGRRGRYRDRKRRGAGGEWDEPEVRDDDVLIPIAGILDVLDNYAFVRTSGYLAGTNDVYVSLGQVKKYHLRRGDAVVGSIRQIPETEQPARQKYNALVKVDSINGLPVAESENRVEFEQLTPLYPQERLRLETETQKLSARVLDLVAPIGKGQRGLIVAPPKSGKTLLLQAIANAVTRNNPEAHLMVVLVDERPEEVTEMQRTVKGEVVAATFDREAEDQTTIADLAIERAKRLVELGYDVVVLLDSITRLTRAYAQTVPVSGRRLVEGLDTGALQPAKRFFAAARNIENGGSLTVLATALVETGSVVDEAILAEFVGTANSELVLSSALADKRIFPAIDITRSGTRREEMLMGPDEVKVVWQLRRAIAGHTPQEALDVVLGKLRETSTNVEFLVQMQKSLPSGK